MVPRTVSGAGRIHFNSYIWLVTKALSMHRITLPLALVILTASCSAQLSLGGKKIDFGVKRKKTTAEVTLFNPATYTSGNTVSWQFKLNNFDESKGISVYMQILAMPPKLLRRSVPASIKLISRLTCPT